MAWFGWHEIAWFGFGMFIGAAGMLIVMGLAIAAGEADEAAEEMMRGMRDGQ